MTYLLSGNAMMSIDARTAIPVALRRRVLVEAGHRCAIPVCRQIPVELAHIVPWAQCRAHDFENLIALCPTCHTRFDSGQIDRQSMLMYKQNLGVVNSRYGEVEKRLMQHFAEHVECDGLLLGADIELSIMYLIRDGLIVRGEPGGYRSMGVPLHWTYMITPKGRNFISNWLEAREIE